MEEEASIKVIATRLRRRASVEADDVKSPASQSTPTKKRGGRLAAKPQLELIDENAAETVPKRTRRSTTRDVTESNDEIPVTPARRNTRARSNTSILSETPSVDAADEKPLTPARRSARIRSNTSLVSDIVINYDSPRAKRAARRNSQVGSDNEAPITPARQTRRTRKDSASSVDKVETNPAKSGTQIDETIVEETDTKNIKDNKSNNTPKNVSPSTRKSPRFKGKDSQNNSITDNDNKENQPQSEKEAHGVANKTDTPMPIQELSVSISPITVHVTQHQEKDSKASDQANVSMASANLIDQMDTNNKKSFSCMNKSASEVEDTNNFKSKRHRTKSLSTISIPQSIDGTFYSDNEGSKKKKRGSGNVDVVNKSSSGDGMLDSKSNIEDKQQDISLSKSTQNTKKRMSKKSLTKDDTNNSFNVGGKNEDPEIKKDSIGLEKKIVESKEENNITQTEHLFNATPIGVVQTLVYIEDSDSNSDSTTKKSLGKQFDSGDQCVPVIVHKLEETSKEPPNDSCEPMDIDETIPDNKSVLVNEKNISALSQKPDGQKRKSSIYIPSENDNVNSSPNRSKRKSSVGNIESQIFDKTENKSTLVLSQIKDFSTNDVPSDTNVTKTISDANEPLSQSANLTETVLNKDIGKNNLSLNCLTSTPLQQKPTKKLGMQINTSIITPTNKNYKDIPTGSRNDISNFSEKDKSNADNDHLNSKSDSSDEEDSRQSSEDDRKLIIDDEAEEAGDDYESGDSRDEEEIQYEEDHEIREKGETLNSDDEEFSDDSEYEKGSFIVSAHEEDEDLLSGSGDDLAMSADELSMSKKSKKKFNERKQKQQKKASREMFEARHKLNESDKNTKSKKTKKANRLDSSDSEEGDVIVGKKKKTRQRIDSSQDNIIELDNSISKTKKNTRRLSDSICEASEKEITICEDGADNKDPLSILNAVKEEPKTPIRDLNISTVQITNMEEVEQINVNENVSILKSHDTSDPLQATAIQNEDENDDNDEVDSLSENEDIAQNYDSVLDNLKNAKTKQIKSLDISLNINKKTKQKAKQPVIDQLNLTQTKKSKKHVKKTVNETEVEPTLKNVALKKGSNKSDAINEDSSDSIDMKLLFPENSNDSEASNSERQSNNVQVVNNEDHTEAAEEFIPLKRTDASTNITESMETPLNDSVLNKSENKKRKSSIAEYPVPLSEEDNNEISFFIDTTGTYTDKLETDAINKSTSKKTRRSKRISETVAEVDKTTDEIETYAILNKSSSKKNKRKRNSESMADVDETTAEIETHATLNKSSSKKNKSKRNSESVADVDDIVLLYSTASKDVSLQNSTTKTNKKEVSEISVSDSKEIRPSGIDVSFKNSPKLSKNKNHSISLNDNEEIKDDVIDKNYNELEVSVKGSEKKNKHKTKDVSLLDEEENKRVELADTDSSIKHSAKKNKKKKTEQQIYVNDDDITELVALSNNRKKNKAKHYIEEIKDVDDYDENVSIQLSAKKSKKYNKNTNLTNTDESQNDFIDEITIDINNEIMNSGKKTKNKIQKDSLIITEEVIDVDDSVANTSMKQKPKKNKKKNKNVSLVDIDEPQDSGDTKAVKDELAEVNRDMKNSGKKNKKNSIPPVDSEVIDVNKVDATASVTKNKKKHSTSLINTEEHNDEENADYINDNKKLKKRKRKTSNRSPEEIIMEDIKITSDMEYDVIGSQIKKRKISHSEVVATQDEGSSDEAPEEVPTKVIKNKNKRDHNSFESNMINQDTSSTTKGGKPKNNEVKVQTEVKKPGKKRKERDDDDNAKTSKVLKQNSLDKIHVPRLPAKILKQLDDKPKKQNIERNKNNVISTTPFVVEPAKKRKNKPSNYLEQSVYLNDTEEEKKPKPSIKFPKVSPFLPTASTSDNGYTTKFRINVMPQEPQFIAKSSDVTHFKNEYLHKAKLKKFGTFEKFKKQRNLKLSKF